MWLGRYATLEDKLESVPRPEHRGEVDRLFYIVKSEMGVAYSHEGARAKTTDLKEYYNQDDFVKVSFAWEGLREKHVKDLKHELVFSETNEPRTDENEIGPNGNPLERPQTAKMPRKSVSLHDLFNTAPPKSEGRPRETRKVLICGNPGTGKTCISKKIAHMWSTDEWGEEFKSVYLLPVRKLNSECYNNNGLRKMKDLSTAVVNTCFAREQEHAYVELRTLIEDDLEKESTLVILDGIDERDEVGKEMEDEAIKRNCSLLLLSRPYNLHMERDFVDVEIECIGFSDSLLVEFVKWECAEHHGEDLVKHMRQTDAVWNVAHIPITAQMICCLWMELPKVSAERRIPANLLLLYSSMVDCVWRHYVEKKKRTSTQRVPRQDHVFSSLQKIAFEAKRKGQIMIEQSLVRKHSTEESPWSDLRDCGFLLLERAGFNFQFPHLTFQEYFAGTFLARALLKGDTADHDRARDFLKKSKYSVDTRMTLVFMIQFVFDKEEISGLRKVFHVLDEERVDVIGVQHMILEMRLLESCLSTQMTQTDLCQVLESKKARTLIKSMTKLLRIAQKSGMDALKNLATYLEDMPNVVKSSSEIRQPLMDSMSKPDLSETMRNFAWIARIVKHSTKEAQELITLLQEGLHHEDLHLRKRAVQQIPTIFKLDPDKALGLMQESFRHGSTYMRAWVIEQTPALFEGAHSQMMELIENGCKDPSPSVRCVVMQQALKIVGLHPDLAIDLIVKGTRDEDISVRETAQQAIPILIEKVPNPTSEIMRMVCEDGDSALHRLMLQRMPTIIASAPKEAVELLKKKCEAHAWYTRAVGMSTIPTIVDVDLNSAVELLSKGLEDKNGEVRRSAMRRVFVLFQKSTETALNAFKAGCDDEDPEVRRMATRLLHILASKDAGMAFILLKKGLEDEHAGVREMAVHILKKLAIVQLIEFWCTCRNEDVVDILAQKLLEVALTIDNDADRSHANTRLHVVESKEETFLELPKTEASHLMTKIKERLELMYPGTLSVLEEARV